MASDHQIARRLFHENMPPALATAASVVVSSLVDAAVTGQCLGKTAVAAFGITNPILFGVIGLSGMFGVGAVIEIGQAVGRSEKDRINPIFSTALAAAVFAGMLIMLCLIAFPSAIAVVMGADAALLNQASDYLRGYSFGVPAFFLQCILSYMMPLDGDKQRVVTAISLCTAANVALDLLNGFVLQWGLLGMALATSVSYWVEFGVLLLHFLRKEKLLRLALRPFCVKDLRGIIRGGTPFALQLLLRMLSIILINRIILSVSDVGAVAVYSLLVSASSLVLIDGTAVSMTLLTVENCFAGEEDRGSVTALMGTALRHGILVNLALTGVFVIAAPLILRLFTRDALLYEPATHAFRLYVSCASVYAVGVAFRSHLQSIRRNGTAMIYAAFDVLLCTVGTAFCLSRLIGTDGIWLSQTIGELLALGGLLACSVLKKGRITARLSDYLFLDPRWEEAEADCLNVTIQNNQGALERAAAASEEVTGFLREHGADERQATLLGVCTEEICTNVVRHGFCKPKHLLELSVRKRSGAWVLRIRDNCEYFNVADYLRIREKQREKYGLRIVAGIAQDVQYLSALKLNNIIIRV